MALGAKPPDVAKYARLANESLARLLSHLPEGERHRSGVFFCLTDEEGQPRLVFQVGEVPVSKLAKYCDFSREKPYRAALRESGTSSGSRDPDRDRWGGAVWGDKTNVYAGVSGLTEEFDELLSTDVLVRAGDMSVEEAMQDLADNTSFHLLVEIFDWANKPL